MPVAEKALRTIREPGRQAALQDWSCASSALERFRQTAALLGLSEGSRTTLAYRKGDPGRYRDLPTGLELLLSIDL